MNFQRINPGALLTRRIFPDPLNPWLSTWPETYSIIPFSGSMNDVDFDAVKIGQYLEPHPDLQSGSGMIGPR